MRYIEALRNSLQYTFSNIPMLLFLGLLSLLLISFFHFCRSPISSIIYTAVGTFIIGFFMKALRDGIYHNTEMPNMRLKLSFIEGIKVYLVNGIYYFVPFGILITILFFFHIRFIDVDGFLELFILSIIGFSTEFLIPIEEVNIIIIIFITISTIFCSIGVARLAKTKKVTKAIDIIGATNDIIAMKFDFIKWLITSALIIFLTFKLCLWLLDFSIYMMIPIYIVIFPIYNIFIYNLLGQFYKENVLIRDIMI